MEVCERRRFLQILPNFKVGCLFSEELLLLGLLALYLSILENSESFVLFHDSVREILELHLLYTLKQLECLVLLTKLLLLGIDLAIIVPTTLIQLLLPLDRILHDDSLFLSAN